MTTVKNDDDLHEIIEAADYQEIIEAANLLMLLKNNGDYLRPYIEAVSGLKRKRSQRTKRHDDDDYEINNLPWSSRNAEKVVKKARTTKNNEPEQKTLSQEFFGAINAMAKGRTITQEPILVIEKRISATDLKDGHNRLAIPYNQVVSRNFLSERECDHLSKREKKVRIDGRPYKNETPCSLEVKVIVPSLECVAMNLRRWEMSNSCIYALTNDWTKIARKNGILLDTVIQVWAFRVEGEENVCFALVVKNLAGEGN